MTTKWFPIPALLLATLVAGARPLPAQTADRPPPPEGFRRRYIDAADRRSGPVLLEDWPELARLIGWSRRLEIAVGEADQTLSADLLAGFRARLDSLSASPLPAFLASREDSIRATIQAVRDTLDRADSLLGEAPPREARPTGGEKPNETGKQRTLVTGRTAVTVPAGVAVGAEDTLPAAELEGAPGETFVDVIGKALGELDRLVHLVRTAGTPASGAPSSPGSRSSPGTAPGRRAP